MNVSSALAMNLDNGHDRASSPSPSPSNGGRLVSAEGVALPLERSHLSVEAGGGLARVVLEQRFVNVHERALSVTYLLPLPASGAVSGFAFTMGDTRIVGEVDRKRAARERFERAIAEGKTAAILDQERSSLFTQEVGNIPPGQTIVCEVTVDQPLVWLAEGAWEWRFPTVVGPRYMGAPGRVKDADKVTVAVADAPMQERLTLSLTIADELAQGAAPESVSHTLKSVARDRGAFTEVTFAHDRTVRLDRDVVVRWAVARPEVGVRVDAARPSGEGHQDRAYGLVTIVPPTPASRPQALARDLIFLIDTSGSMGGRPLDQAKRVVCAMIDTLGDKDRIELIEFGSRPVRWRQEPVAATRDGRKEAMAWVKKLGPSGATEMHSAVLEALTPLRPGCQRQVVLITDGFIGFESQIVSAILEHLPENCRLHTIGVGSAPNRSLTRPAARAGAGVELIIGLGEDAERVARRLLERTTAPLITDVRIEGPGVVDVRPHRIPDLFAGSPVLVSVALAPKGGPITVRGTMAGNRDVDGDPGTEVFEHTVDPWGGAPSLLLGQGAQAIAALYGRECVEDLETRASVRGNTQDIDHAIERIGLDFQIATRMTSWIAITEDATITEGERGGALRQEMPHELPHGTSIEGFGLRAAGAAPIQGQKMRMRLSKADRGKSGRMFDESSVLYSVRDMRMIKEEEADAAPMEAPVMYAAAAPKVPRPEPQQAAMRVAAPKTRATPWLAMLLVLIVLLGLGFGLWYWFASGV